jgi:hypothetical protein
MDIIMSKSHNTSLERLSELTERQAYMHEFFDRLMVTIQRPNNIHWLKSQPYSNLMRKLQVIQEQRGKFSDRGNQLSLTDNLDSQALQELHYIRIVDSGLLSSMWDAIREFVNSTDMNLSIDERRT